MNNLLLYLSIVMMLWAVIMAADTSDAVAKCQTRHSIAVCTHSLNR